MNNTQGWVLLLVKLQASACNFTKSTTLTWVFFTFLKLYKWYQIVQRPAIFFYVALDLIIYENEILIRLGQL